MRLLTFGDSFAATGHIPAEDIAAGRPPSWCDLLAERLGCELIIQGVNCTGPMELIYQLNQWKDFRSTDIVICVFSAVHRFCLQSKGPALNTMVQDITDSNIDYSELQQKFFDHLPIGQVARLFQTYRWYAAHMENSYRQTALHRTALLALDGIAAREPARFYMKYSFDKQVNTHQLLSIEPRFFKYLPGSCYSACGEEPGRNITNHFVTEAVEPFVDYLYREITQDNT